MWEETLEYLGRRSDVIDKEKRQEIHGTSNETCLHRACIRSSDAAPSSMKLIARLLELGGRDLTNLVFYEHPILVRRPYTALLYACLNKSPTNEIF